MSPLVAARAQMEVSLAFHMVFAALGIAMPLFMCVAEGLWLRTRAPHWLALAKTWGKVTSLLFAIGAVSGTALSFELGLLWPRFMQVAGASIGPAFALEGYAFFLEAIGIGLYLYGWERLSPRAHWLAGVGVTVSGVASGVLVLAANAWMQVPTPLGSSPAALFASPTWAAMSVHNTLACVIASGFAVGGVYAVGMLRGRRDAYHRGGVAIALGIASVAAALQLVSGDATARNVARYQPAKLAAAEAHFVTEGHAPLVVGGAVDVEAQRVRMGIEVPSGLSLLVGHDPGAVVPGLDGVPVDERPNVPLVHASFDVMVGCGFAMIGVGGVFAWTWWRRRGREPRLALRIIAAASPLGFIALEAGWMVAEGGRQPWIARGVMRTRDAITPATEVGITFATFTALYVVLGAILVVLLRRLAHRGARGEHGGGEASAVAAIEPTHAA